MNSVRGIFSFILVLLSLVFLPELALSQSSVQGVIQKDSHGNIFIFSYHHHHQFKLLAENSGVTEQLKKLESQDVLQGTAVIGAGSEMILHSVDFVGLRKLLGNWKSDSVMVRFSSFVDVSLYSQEKRGNFKYVLAPSTGSQWTMFLTDENRVAMGTLVMLSSEKAMVTIRDANGQVAKTFPLTKIRNN
jgi:hypothetical protein